MSVLCTICHENLTEKAPQLPGANEDSDKYALRCGHLFHSVCLRQWFKTSAQRNGLGPRAQAGLAGDCPCCKKSATIATAIKIFPTGDEDADDPDAANQQRHEDVQRLSAELDEVEEEVETLMKALEEQTAAHNLLKVQYGEAISKVHHLEESLKENDLLMTAMEHSFRSEMDKTEMEKNHALAALADMACR